MSKLRDNWTKDAQGNYVDWTLPPYRQPDSGLGSFVLEGENFRDIPIEEFTKRIREYDVLCRRQMQRARDKRDCPDAE